MPSICRVLSFYSSTKIKGKPMDISKYVTVTINDGRFIPFINRRGPVRTPIAISRGVYETLLSRGYKVILMASYNKNGKLNKQTQTIGGGGKILSSANLNKPSAPVNKPAEEKKETPPPAQEEVKKEVVETPAEPKAEEKEEKEEVKKEVAEAPAQKDKKEETKEEVVEEKKETHSASNNKNKSLRVFKK